MDAERRGKTTSRSGGIGKKTNPGRPVKVHPEKIQPGAENCYHLLPRLGGMAKAVPIVIAGQVWIPGFLQVADQLVQMAFFVRIRRGRIEFFQLDQLIGQNISKEEERGSKW